ncbi:thiol-activated cytolysin family protein [Halochromatium roseum]|uniref:thiol-activated cytolysin family protein n=1 Tax=Halochromatium roseum TaxID=391920 RepID=UPI0019118CD5|nr:thiol-activated cytolysin family protein [Halochromatium roseum]MBK5938570.1 hypothetical protein [Halochromatium roseum]
MLLKNPRWFAALSFGFCVATSAAASNYIVTPNAAISGHNVRSINGLAACKAECDRADWCKSFDYYKREDKCDLSDKAASDVGGLKTDYPNNPYDHYAKNFSQYVKILDPDAGTVTELLRSLEYDPRRLLAVVEPGASEVLPAKTDDEEDGTTIVCKNKRHTADGLEFQEVSLFSTQAAIFPGSVIWADANLADGNPTPIGLPLGQTRLTLLLDTPTGASETVEGLNVQSAQLAKGRLLDAFFKGKNFGKPARVKSFFDEVESAAEISMKAGFRAKWGNKNGFLKTDIGVNKNSSTVFGSFTQVYYSIAADIPDLRNVFSADVTPEQLAKLIAKEDAPPAYISRVDYGRQVLVKMVVDGTHSDSHVKSAFEYVKDKSSNARGKLNADLKTDLDHARFEVFVFGGPSAKTFVVTGLDNAVEKLKAALSADIDLDEQSGALPIAYSVKFLDSNQAARIGLTTSYIEHECIEHKNARAYLRNASGYRVFASVYYKKNGKRIYVFGDEDDMKLIRMATTRTVATTVPPEFSDKVFYSAETGGGALAAELAKDEPLAPNTCIAFKGLRFGEFIEKSEGRCK